MHHRYIPSSLAVFAVLVTASIPALAGPSDPDAGFGTNGVVIENLGATETGGRVLQLSTGKLLLVGGGSGTAAGHSFTRYNTNGTKDGTYGTGGTAAGFPGGPVGVTLLAGDELLVAGAVDMGNLTELNDAEVSRYTSTGAKDTSFGTGGHTIFRFDPANFRNEIATHAIELASGKVLVCGWFWKGGTDFDIAVVRLDATGAIDTTFADAGHFNFDFGGGIDKPTQVLELPDKKLIVYGEVQDKANPGQLSKVFFLRLTENGQVDTTFGGSGTGWKTVITDVNSDAPGAMTRLSTGKFLFAIGGTALWTAGRLNADGTLDGDFGTAGITNLGVNFLDTFYPGVTTTGLAVQSDGRFVLGGWLFGVTASYQLKYDVGLARFEADGSWDMTFHANAQRTYTITDTAPEAGADVIVQKDGKIVLGGSYPNGSDDRYMLRVTGDEPQVTTTTSTTTTTLADLCGDVNGDGKVRSSDALATLKAAVGLTTCPLSVCDANGDGKVRSTDALRVLQYAVGGSVAMNCPA